MAGSVWLRLSLTFCEFLVCALAEEVANRLPNPLWTELTSAKCFNVTSLKRHVFTHRHVSLTASGTVYISMSVKEIF